MDIKRYILIPFSHESFLNDFSMICDVDRRHDILLISYILTGPVSKILIPELSSMPVRKNDLWQETCFEFFLGVINSPSYWEFNLSPSGHWNAYMFKGYRQDMKEDPDVSLSFNVKRHHETLNLFLELNLSHISVADKALEAGISSVIKFLDGHISYWAITHTSFKADFHRRDSFIAGL